MNREPVLTAATISSAVVALLALLVAFGIDLTKEQQAAILGVVAVAAPLIVAAVSRRKVTPLSDPKDEQGRELTPAP